MKPFSKQRGYTLITLIFIFSLIGFFTLLTLKIAPIYIDHSKVVNSLEALKEMDGIENFSRRRVHSALEKRFIMNYVDFIQPNEIKITKHGAYIKVEIEYEVIEKIIGNLSVLVEFSETMEVGET